MATEQSTQRAVTTTALVLEGLPWDDPSDEEYLQYQVRYKAMTHLHGT